MRISWISAKARCSAVAADVGRAGIGHKRQRGRGGQAPEGHPPQVAHPEFPLRWRQFRAGFRFGQASPRCRSRPRRRPNHLVENVSRFVSNVPLSVHPAMTAAT